MRSKALIRKQHALLLEVLIAFTLVTLCLFPLLYPHIHMLSSTKQFTKTVELDRVVDEVFAETFEKLYKNAIPWDVIQSNQFQATSHPQLQKLNFQGFSKFKELKNKKGKEEAQTYHSIMLTLAFMPPGTHESIEQAIEKKKALEFNYTLFIERQLLIGQDTSVKASTETTQPKEKSP